MCGTIGREGPVIILLFDFSFEGVEAKKQEYLETGTITFKPVTQTIILYGKAKYTYRQYEISSKLSPPNNS